MSADRGLGVPAGGATGGGKVSGAGGQGLEGPLPPPLAEELDRLAGQQAILVHRAERLVAGLGAADLSAVGLLEAVAMMSRLRDDLSQDRYRNALRAGAVAVTALRRAAAGGDVTVIVDPRRTLPEAVRKDIANAVEGPLLAEFRGPLRAYYRRLAEQAGAD